jgi:Domain of unknown function (DUF1707)
MNGEQLPAGDAAAQRAPAPAIRVSHADRDQVVEVLREAAGDGRLTAEELDERVTAALAARTGSDLAVLTADLPALPAGPVPKDLIKISQRFGNVERTGRWVVPRRIEIDATAGNVKLDFTEAVITFGSLRIEVDLGLGADLVLITKPGIEVLTDDLTVRMGDVRVRKPRSDAAAPVILSIEVGGQVRGADIVVRHPRRTPSQWLRRESPFSPRRPLRRAATVLRHRGPARQGLKTLRHRGLPVRAGRRCRTRVLPVRAGRRSGRRCCPRRGGAAHRARR